MHSRELGPQPLLQAVGRASLGRMVDADLEIPCLYYVDCWQFLPYIWPVDIAVYSSEWAYLSQRVHEPFAGEVPRVNDRVCAG